MKYSMVDEKARRMFIFERIWLKQVSVAISRQNDGRIRSSRAHLIFDISSAFLEEFVLFINSWLWHSISAVTAGLIIKFSKNFKIRHFVRQKSLNRLKYVWLIRSPETNWGWDQYKQESAWQRRCIIWKFSLILITSPKYFTLLK